jgi:hypothetical protein
LFCFITGQKMRIGLKFTVENKSYSFVNGVIKRERLPVFERVLWRACYGKVFLRQAEISESIAEAATVSFCFYTNCLVIFRNPVKINPFLLSSFKVIN